MSEIRRKLHDGSVDLINSRSDWQIQVGKGAELLKKLADSRLVWLSSDDKTKSNQLDKSIMDWMELSDQLAIVTDRLTLMVEKMSRIADSFATLNDLSQLSNSSFNNSFNCSNNEKSSLCCKTWDLAKFSSTAQRISEMFTAELKCKMAVIQTLPNCQSHADFTTVTAGWIHQPYICQRTLDDSLNNLMFEAQL